MKIVLLESLGISSQRLHHYAEPLIKMGHEFLSYERDLDEETQISRCQDADVIVLANMPLPGRVISACRNLKFIDVAFTGVDHIDLEAAKAGHVQVSNAAGYSTQAVAELTLGTMLALLRKLPQVEQRCRAGQTKEGLVGCELRGKTVGIIGTGAIGQRVAQLCGAFGCRVLGYQRSPLDHPLIQQADLNTLLKESDLISLHCPLNDQSKGLINRETIALMKPSALLINMARGPVVDSAALAEALNSGRIAGAAVDVFETEPPLDPAHPLLHSKNTIVTPHVAFASQESMEERAKIVFDNLTGWLSGNQQNVIL